MMFMNVYFRIKCKIGEIAKKKSIVKRVRCEVLDHGSETSA